MRKLSTDDNSTLGNYRKLSLIIFGEDSPATKFLDGKISEQGEDEEVIQDEGQMIYLLTKLHEQSNHANALEPSHKAAQAK